MVTLLKEAVRRKQLEKRSKLFQLVYSTFYSQSYRTGSSLFRFRISISVRICIQNGKQIISSCFTRNVFLFPKKTKKPKHFYFLLDYVNWTCLNCFRQLGPQQKRLLLLKPISKTEIKKFDGVNTFEMKRTTWVSISLEENVNTTLIYLKDHLITKVKSW